MLYENRMKVQGVQTEPQNPEDIQLDNDILSMFDGTSFLLADDGVENRILIFASAKGREVLAQSKQFFMDGTFKSSSIQFTQIYILYADLGSAHQETNIVPVAFTLVTYDRKFQLIEAQVPDWNPERVNNDFELAAISALKTNFPTTQIHGCYFHFAQAVWRKIQEYGLVTYYQRDAEICQIVRMCIALAFLRSEDVEEGFLQIMDDAPELANDEEDEDEQDQRQPILPERNRLLTKFLNYFVKQWLENNNVPIKMWNCYRTRHRTNNGVEGRNHIINNFHGFTNPRFKNVIKCLKQEAAKADAKILRSELHLEGVKRKKKYMILDERIEKNTEVYDNDGDIKKFLKKISYIVKLD